ncbi:MAG: NAD(P)-binding protein [Proteobacteria bacterium]|nr:NAD(P)-binding protein [Pseudomonadota bacterium]
MAAAFELTRPELAGKYDVTVYQLGWRLGGKGASGRGPADRIEEHGLHLWMGFYENAFRLMRECYEELGRDPSRCPIATWTDAFVPDHFCGTMDRAPDGTWLPWAVHFPPTKGQPGDPDLIKHRWTVADYLQRSLSLARTLFRAVQERSGPEARPELATSPVGAAPSELRKLMAELMARRAKGAEYAGLATWGSLIYGLRVLDEVVRLMPRFPGQVILDFHAAIANSARSQLRRMTRSDTELRRLWEIIDLVLAVVRGIIGSGLVFDRRGFDAIDGYDCREWLMRWGASKESVESAFVRALYDLAFAYEDGDVTRPRIAAGQALRGALRAFFTYRGAFFWKMQAGMGDVVFAPLYEVLKRRGVGFKFFHKLTGMGVGRADGGADGAFVETLTFDVQAKVRGGRAYRPLVSIRGLPCWPAAPRWNQLVGGEMLRKQGWEFESHWERRRAGARTLRVGRDFDLVVLAVGVGEVPHVAREIIEQDARWQQWATSHKSVATQALQLWLRDGIAELGWTQPSINISGFVEPFDTWADMSHLTSRESYPLDPGGSSKVKSIAYFCSVLPDPEPGVNTAAAGYPAMRRKEVRDNALRFLNTDVGTLWPNAVAPKGFRWNLLVTPDTNKGPAGKARLESQFYIANVDPTMRYSLSLPGTLQHRISPLHRTHENLTVAGDWTGCGFTEGCVEAAVMSGKLAAHALSGSPPLEEIVGFDHP